MELTTKSKNETKRIKVHIGYTCNSNCRFFYYFSRIHEPPLPTSVLLQEIKLARQLVWEDIDFTGGEPTIVSELEKLIAVAKEEGFRDIAIITNGIRLADRNYFKRLNNAGLNDVLFSLHGANSKIHDFLTRVPGSFEKIINAIQTAKELGIKVRTNITINTYNYTTLPAYANLVSQLGVNTVNFIFFNPWTTKNVELNKLMPRFTEVIPYLEKSIDILESNKTPKIVIRYVPYCVLNEKYRKYICDFNQRVYDPDEWGEPFSAFSEWLASKLSVRSNKIKKLPTLLFEYYKFFIYNYTITLLRNLKSPNVIFDSLLSKQKAYQNASALTFNVKNKKCSDCLYFNDCDGIKREYATLIGMGEFKPVTLRVK
jgi:MoaA/NifB/PqqE/SkfB family radical SAM enzyme